MESPDTFEIINLDNGSITAKIVVTIGNTLISLRNDQEEKFYFPYTLGTYKSNTKLAGNPFMHPWANRLEGDYIYIQNRKHAFPEELKSLLYRDGNGLPLHGLLLKSNKWVTIEKTNTSHTAAFDFKEADLLAIFPYRHTIQIRHTLTENGIYIETTLFNQDNKPMPVSFGFHPYFLINPARRADYQLTIPAEDVIEVNEVMIPSGKVLPKSERWDFSGDKVLLKGAAFDDGFQRLKRNERDKVVFALNELQVEMDGNYPFSQIYAPENRDKPYVCIEPMTAATNALNTNTCRMIKPGEKFAACFSIFV